MTGFMKSNFFYQDYGVNTQKCRECGNVYGDMGFRGHLKKKHEMTYMEYLTKHDIPLRKNAKPTKWR